MPSPSTGPAGATRQIEFTANGGLVRRIDPATWGFEPDAALRDFFAKHPILRHARIPKGVTFADFVVQPRPPISGPPVLGAFTSPVTKLYYEPRGLPNSWALAWAEKIRGAR